MSKNILIVIVAIVVAGVVFVGAQKLTSHEPVVKENTSELNNNKEEVTDWKVYKNAEYGFELKYPSGWSPVEGRFPTVSLTPRTDINVFSNPQQLPLIEWLEKERPLFYKKETISVNGMTAVKGSESGMVGYDAIYFGNNSIVVGIISQKNSQDTEFFEEMIQTFKFIK